MRLYIVILLVMVCFSYFYMKLAIKYKIVDKPNQRSSHDKLTIRGGGIIFPISIILFFILNNYQYPYLVSGVFLISIISFLDDLYTLSSKIRLSIQLISVVLVLVQVGITLNPLHIFTLSIFFGLGVVNMFNFMDGINGITGLYSISVLLGFYFINLNENLINSELIIYCLISLLTFGFYNFRKKALFFAGDVGSIVIGLLIFFLGIFFLKELETPMIFALIIVYGADSTLTLMYRKFFTRENVFDAHRQHVYQKLIHIGRVSHLKVSAGYALIQTIVNLIVFKTYKLSLYSQFFVLASLVIIFIIIYILIFLKLSNNQEIA